jgi:hypothetical protein
MPTMKRSCLRPFWRTNHTRNGHKVTVGKPLPQKDVKNEGRSGNVYENKGLSDKMPRNVSGISARLKAILYKIAAVRDYCMTICPSVRLPNVFLVELASPGELAASPQGGAREYLDAKLLNAGQFCRPLAPGSGGLICRSPREADMRCAWEESLDEKQNP